MNLSNFFATALLALETQTHDLRQANLFPQEGQKLPLSGRVALHSGQLDGRGVDCGAPHAGQNLEFGGSAALHLTHATVCGA
jgi:hypothetical protein